MEFSKIKITKIFKKTFQKLWDCIFNDVIKKSKISMRLRTQD